jgi:putative membrane protein
MDVVINLLIFAHVVAFVAGGANSVVGPVIGSRLASATPDARQGYFGVMNTLSRVGKVAMMVLLVSGPLILLLRYGGLAGANAWFWIKMVLIVVMLASIIYGGINFKKAQGGDVAAGKRAGMAHRVTGLAFLGVLLSAVFAFS